MKPISPDLRQRIVTARFEAGLSLGEIAERFGMSRSSVQHIVEDFRDRGTIEPRPANAGRHAAFEGEELRRLEQDVLEHPDATLAELHERSGVQSSLVAVHNALKRLGFTRKKKRYVRPSSSAPTSAPGGKRG